MKLSAAACLDRVRTHRPLIHCITNPVTIHDCANSALALGASPIMADDPDEAAEITANARALVLNLGTPNPRRLDAMVRAGQTANRLGLPVILDPVGAGASALRRDAVARLTREVRLSIIRCNAAEAAFLTGLGQGAAGVDADEAVRDPDLLAPALARRLGCTAAVTGPVDRISDGQRLFRIANGHAMLSRVTGTGCVTTVLTGCLAAQADDPLTAAVAGVGVMGVCGERAYARAGLLGTGSFRVALTDALSLLTGRELAEALRIEEVVL